jgi:hypothetical protein
MNHSKGAEMFRNYFTTKLKELLGGTLLSTSAPTSDAGHEEKYEW